MLRSQVSSSDHHRVLGVRGRAGPAVTADKVVELIMVLPGSTSAAVRQKAASLLSAWLGGEKIPRRQMGRQSKEMAEMQALLQGARPLPAVADAPAQPPTIEDISPSESRRKISKKSAPNDWVVLSAMPRVDMLRTDLEAAVLHLAVLVRRDAALAQQIAPPEWAAVPRDELLFWAKAATRFALPAGSGPHENRWIMVPVVHAELRESAVLWGTEMYPLLAEYRDEEVCELVVAAMMARRHFHNPVFWPKLWAFYKNRVRTRSNAREGDRVRVQPLSELKDDFVLLWENEVRAADGRETGAYGPGRPALFPGAATLLQGAWEYLLVFERVAGHVMVVVWQMDRGMISPDALVDQLTALIGSRLAPGMDTYSLRHLCNDLAYFLGGPVAAHNERMYQEAAGHLRSNPRVGPGPRQYLRAKLRCRAEGQRLTSTNASRDSILVQAMRDAVAREVGQGASRAASALREALAISGTSLPDAFDFQVFLC